MNKIQKRILEVIIVLTCGVFLMWKTLLPLCFIYKNALFDALDLFFWDYTALKNFIPQKDIFFPYGILTYFRNVNLFAHIITCIIFLGVMLLFYYAFKSIVGTTNKALISFLAFVLFIHFTVNVDVVIRYGILIVVSFLLAKTIDKNKGSLLLLIGIFSGCLLMAIPDIGIYSFILGILGILILAFLAKYIQPNFSLNTYSKMAGLFISGFSLIVIPFILYFLVTNTLPLFVSQFTFWKDLSLIAKTPFIPSLRSPENIFTLLALIGSITYLSFYFLFIKKKISFIIAFQIFISFSLILLEQKSIIRSIDTQLTLFAFMLYFLLFYQIRYYILQFIPKKVFLGLLFIFFFSSLVLLRPANYIKEGTFLLSANTCLKNNIAQVTNKNNSYANVVNFLKMQNDFNNKIFSFPGDPIYYVLLNQKPPFFPEIYDASSKNTQEKQIAYINTNHIMYVIFNKNTKAIEDGVPDYMRGSTLYSYLLQNYYPIQSFGNFLVLKKNDEVNNFFSGLIFLNQNDTLSYFTNINFGMAAYSEGLYKYKKTKSVKIFSGNVQDLQKYLENNYISSHNLFLVLQLVSKSDSYEQLSISTENSLGSKISFNSKKGVNQYLFDFSKIPILYTPKRITQLQLPNNTIEVQLFQSSDPLLW